MTEYMHLVGSEEVQRAASTMSSAASEMQQAANTICESNDMFIRRFEELVGRMEQIAAADAHANGLQQKLMRLIRKGA